MTFPKELYAVIKSMPPDYAHLGLAFSTAEADVEASPGQTVAVYELKAMKQLALIGGLSVTGKEAKEPVPIRRKPADDQGSL